MEWGIPRMKTKQLLAVSAFALAFAMPSVAQADVTFMDAGQAKEEYLENESPDVDFTPIPIQGGGAGYGTTVVAGSPGSRVSSGFEGMSQYTVGSFGRGFIPPDTMGAVGRDQYVEMINGGFGVWNKAGANLVTTSDLNFWAAAGQTGANGDSRVLFNAAANRWIALSFGSSVSDIQIAVSNTADATGTWKSTKFTGFAGGTADYPTMAMDTNALYIGTNNFAPGFKGTTLNVIPLSSLLDAAGPTTANKTSI